MVYRECEGNLLPYIEGMESGLQCLKSGRAGIFYNIYQASRQVFESTYGTMGLMLANDMGADRDNGRYR